MRKLLFIFLDGVGLGKENNFNPIEDLFINLTNKKFIESNFPLITDELLLKPIDPILGVPGIPQSATGQTSIMTGISGQGVLGHHHTAFPNKKLIELIKTENILLTLKKLGIKSTCANMYSKEYFEKRNNRRKNMLPVSALSVLTSDLPFRFIEDYNNGEAVFADITNNIIKSRGYDIDIITPEVAAKNMLNIFKNNDFAFFEYFITDTYGHKKMREELLYEVKKLNIFIQELWGNGNNDIDIILTSDHGNSEDISSGNHTRNNVPFLYISKNRELKNKFANEIEKITDFKGAILKHFSLI